jgi:hypothetical protein
MFVLSRALVRTVFSEAAVISFYKRQRWNVKAEDATIGHVIRTGMLHASRRGDAPKEYTLAHFTWTKQNNYMPNGGTGTLIPTRTQPQPESQS